MVMILRSRRFVLRPFRKGDEASLRRNINNRKIYRYTLRIHFPFITKHANDWIKKNISLQKKKKASARVMQKAGFRFEGLMRKFHKKDGNLLDVLMYAKTR